MSGPKPWVRTKAGLIVPATAILEPPKEPAKKNRAERRREMREKKRAERKGAAK